MRAAFAPAPSSRYLAGMSSIRFLSKLLIFALALWAMYTSLSAFSVSRSTSRSAAEEAIPYHRWQTARIAVFLTFAYYAVMHLIAGSREMYPIQFLETYVKILTITGAILFYRSGVPAGEYAIVAFFQHCSLILHLAARPHFKKYFARK